MMNYDQYITSKQHQYGAQFDASDLDPRFARYYHTETRIKVETCGMVFTGTVGATTGWKPCFLLMRTKRSMGSPWTLGPRDRILAVQNSRGKYISL